jgi:ATP-binding cassette subfamily F protein 3
VLRLERIGKIYPTGEVLRDVTWEVKPGDRIGLVGVNGAGKSTQMRIIAGLEEPSSGQVVKQGAPRIVYLQQEFDVDPRRTVRAELFQAFGEAAEVLNRQQQVEGLHPRRERTGYPRAAASVQALHWRGEVTKSLPSAFVVEEG